jgi:hypothetical protein
VSHLAIAPRDSIPLLYPNGPPLDMVITAHTVITLVAGKKIIAPPFTATRDPIWSIYRNNTEQNPLRYQDYLKYQHQGIEILADHIRHLTCTPCNIWDLQNVSEEFENLESLTLANCPSLDDFYFTRPLRKLKRLALDNLPCCKGSSLSNLTDPPKGKLPALQHLIIKNCPLFDDQSLYEIAQLLRQRLACIVLENLPNITSNGLDVLSEEIKPFSGRLFIQNITIRDKCLGYDGNFYVGYRRLQEVVRKNVQQTRIYDRWSSRLRLV